MQCGTHYHVHTNARTFHVSVAILQPSQSCHFLKTTLPANGEDFSCREQAGVGAEPTNAELCTMILIDIERLQSVGRQQLKSQSSFDRTNSERLCYLDRCSHEAMSAATQIVTRTFI